ncbi:hypothetical protein DL93DRAFT_136035 [Clavulina sp. PMI_390]|nr:hypothetical protein DL93DRAFT_136035 [Clavulina sp. PMI_390]
MYMPNAFLPSRAALLKSREIITKKDSIIFHPHTGGTGIHSHLTLIAVIIVVSVVVIIIVTIIAVWLIKQRRIRKRNEAERAHNQSIPGATESTVNLASAGAPPAAAGGSVGFTGIVNSLSPKTGSYMPVTNTNQAQSGNLGPYEPPTPATVGAGYVSIQPHNAPTSWPASSYEPQAWTGGSYPGGGPNQYPIAPMGSSQNTYYGPPIGYDSRGERDRIEIIA